MFSDSIRCKQYEYDEPRSDCSLWNCVVRAHNLCFHDKRRKKDVKKPWLWRDIQTKCAASSPTLESAGRLRKKTYYQADSSDSDCPSSWYSLAESVPPQDKQLNNSAERKTLTDQFASETAAYNFESRELTDNFSSHTFTDNFASQKLSDDFASCELIDSFKGNDDHYDGNGSQQPWTVANHDLSVTWDLVIDSERCECNKPDTIAIPLLTSRGPLNIHSSTAENLGSNITENSQECDSFDQFYDLETDVQTGGKEVTVEETDVQNGKEVTLEESEKFRDSLSAAYIRDKYCIRSRCPGEKVSFSTANAVDADTHINNKKHSVCTADLAEGNKTTKSLSDPNSKCLLFSQARYFGDDESKFSTAGGKSQSETIKYYTPSGLTGSGTVDCGDKCVNNKVEINQVENGSGNICVFSKETSIPCGISSLKPDQSDLESYYTAATDFGSDFFGFSTSSFVTCRESLSTLPRSKFTKAKDILIKGRNYVRTKFENYQKKFPGKRKPDKQGCGEGKLCNTCQFPCFFPVREISQISFAIPECSAAQGDNSHRETKEKGSNSKSKNGLSDRGGVNGEMSEESDLKDNQGIKSEGSGTEEFCDAENGPENKRSKTSLKQETEDAVKGQDTGKKMTVKLKEENVQTASVGEGSSQVTKATVSDEGQDDLPIGTEAQTMMKGHDNFKSEMAEQKPTNKRLRWLSTMDKTQSNSLNSSTTSTSSVEQFLYERETDPEKMLKSLGFGFSPDADVSYGRIPDRFLLSPSSAGGIDLYQFVLHHPDLHHLLWIWDKQSGTQSVSSSSNQSTGKKTDGWSRQPTFSSLVHGVKFIQTTQSEAESHQQKQVENANSNAQDISKINSILDYPNRAFLASQGFYGKEYVSKEPADKDKDKEQSESNSTRVSAAQKRKQFHQSSRSKNWSLTDDGDGVDLTVSDSTGSSGSDDRGLILRSFSEGMSVSSESSLEGGDSFNEEDRRNSIRNLRKQYQEAIFKSMESEFPVFPGSSNEEKDKIKSTGERRKLEVDRLMASLEDDGDYFAQSRQSSIKEVDSIKKRSQPSKDSTLTGSPVTPKLFNFSFEKDDKDKKEFRFSNPTSPVNPKPTQEISIIVEDETDSKLESQVEAEIKITKAHSNLGLSPFDLMNARSDSSHTLVSQDSNFDVDSLGGDLTPRPGDVSPGVLEHSHIFINEKQLCGEELSESTSSSGTLHAMLFCDTDQDQRSRSASQVSMTTLEEPGIKGERLKPVACPPQESFELEEISSGIDNGFDDMLYPSNRLPRQKGAVEKSASFQSDSSGFADVESPGETSLSYLDLQQDSGRKGVIYSHDKNALSPPLYRHDNRNNAKLLHPVSSRNQLDEEKLKEQLSKTIHSKGNIHVCSKSDVLSQSEADRPALESISYTINRDQTQDKSLVYTIDIPYDLAASRSRTQRRRKLRKYVSTMSVDITVKPGKSKTGYQNVFTAKGPVDYREIKVDLDPDREDPKIDSSVILHEKHMQELAGLEDIHKQSAKVGESAMLPQNYRDLQGTNRPLPSNRSDKLLLGNRERSKYNENDLALKQKVKDKHKSKETLASAKSQMVDWLLSNQRQKDANENTLSPSKYGHPLSMSTPSLKIKRCSDKQLIKNQSSFERRSFDSREILNGENSVGEHRRTYHRNYNGHSFDSADILNPDILQTQSMGSPASSLESFHNKSNLHTQIYLLPGVSKHGDSALSEDESVGVGYNKRVSLSGSSVGLPEEELGYLKLARLVNGPATIMGIGGHMAPMVQFKPAVPVKHWTDLNKTKQLEEETRLMQHAMQRYKTEMVAMETTLFSMSQLASTELTDEERADVEELQCLWSEVRKEIEKMEEHLSRRLSSVLTGNDNFNTLTTMDIVQTMIDLLREQLYQQQLSLSRDISYDEDDLDLDLQSPTSSIPSVAMSEPILAEVADIKETLMRTQLQHQKDLSKSFSDLKEALVDEVRAEVSSNTSWLQQQLHAKDSEIHKLKTEMFLQNLKSGTSRKKQYFESDV